MNDNARPSELAMEAADKELTRLHTINFREVPSGWRLQDMINREYSRVGNNWTISLTKRYGPGNVTADGNSPLEAFKKAVDKAKKIG